MIIYFVKKCILRIPKIRNLTNLDRLIMSNIFFRKCPVNNNYNTSKFVERQMD